MQPQLAYTAAGSYNNTNANTDLSAVTFAYRCLLRPLRLMCQVVVPSKIGDTLSSLYKNAQESLDSFLCTTAGKARRKERDGEQNATDTKLYLEESVLERKLPEADLKALVDLPAGLDYNEWLASHTLALFEHVNLVYGTISEFCTPSGCPDMTGPGNRTYLWFDEKGKKTRVAAPQYIDYVLTFTQKTVSDESIFPTKYANEFPSSFESIARKILRLQFHVIAHLYAAHFREIALLGLHTHLNLTFAHLTALHRRFNLIDEKETDVLRDLELALRLIDDNTNNSNNNHSNTNNTNNNTTTANGATNTGGGTNSSTSNSNQHKNNNNYNYNNNNNNNNNSNFHTNQQQQQMCEYNKKAVSDITNNTTTTTNSTTDGTFLENSTSVINETTTTNHLYEHNDKSTVMINNSGGGGGGGVGGVGCNNTIIDGDANVPPICAQPETANKYISATAATSNCSNNDYSDNNRTTTTTTNIGTITATTLNIKDRDYNSTSTLSSSSSTQKQQQQHNTNKVLQQQQHQHQQQQKIIDHVHTRLIQCNASTGPYTIGGMHNNNNTNNFNNP